MLGKWMNGMGGHLCRRFKDIPKSWAKKKLCNPLVRRRSPEKPSLPPFLSPLFFPAKSTWEKWAGKKVIRALALIKRASFGRASLRGSVRKALIIWSSPTLIQGSFYCQSLWLFFPRIELSRRAVYSSCVFSIQQTSKARDIYRHSVIPFTRVVVDNWALIMR